MGCGMTATTEYQSYANKYWPKAPDERDQEIYHQCRVECKSQREVAELHGLTQGRVSQIVRQVEQYGMVGILLQHSLPEEKLQAKAVHRQQVAYAQKLAIAEFHKQSKAEAALSRKEALNGEGQVVSAKNERNSKPGKPSAKWLELFVHLAKKLEELSIEVAELRFEAHEELSKFPDWKEDHDAHFVIQIREELQRYVDRCKELKRPCPILPREEKWETEEWTRHERRENPNGNMWDCVHPKWSKVAKMVFFPHLDPNEPMPASLGDINPSVVVQKAYPQAAPEGEAGGDMAGDAAAYPDNTFWEQWQKHLHEGGPWQWQEAPPGGDGVTYPDGSWETPNGMTGGGPPGKKSMADQAKEERENGGSG